jgi:hypothetical protein
VTIFLARIESIKEVCETGEAAREEICVIPAYCAILKNAFDLSSAS